jgi:hypothetical protein
MKKTIRVGDLKSGDHLIRYTGLFYNPERIIKVQEVHKCDP